jgi:aminoglycoside phosphotransferase
MGTGLHALPAAFPVMSCPFTWSAADRLADARRKAAAGQLDPEGWHEARRPLGVADRWADIAVAAWSAEWNFGPGWEPLLLDAYGIAPDPERSRYYRLLWDLSS